MQLRDEQPCDEADIAALHLAAFSGSRAEPDIVALARRRGQLVYSLVAENGDRIAGHVMVSPMTLTPARDLRCIAIGPIGVLPRHQNRGIGSKLMQEVIRRAGRDGFDAILLLGNPHYYHRFGFTTAPVQGRYQAGDAFMALQLTPGCLDELEGNNMAQYISAFAEAESGMANEAP